MILTIGKPSPKQVQFLTAETKYVGFGGARGGGKSWSVRTKAKLMALKYPGIKQLIVRRTYPELINNHINALRVELLNIARYRRHHSCCGNGIHGPAYTVQWPVNAV